MTELSEDLASRTSRAPAEVSFEELFDALAEADAAVSIGYSLPPTDASVQWMLVGIGRWRRGHWASTQPSPRLIVVEPSSAPESLFVRSSRVEEEARWPRTAACRPTAFSTVR